MRHLLPANYRRVSRVAALVFALLASSVVTSAQAPAVDANAKDTLSGKYEGTAKSTGVADNPLTLELKNEGGKLSGQLIGSASTLPVSEGSIVDGKLTLKFGKGGTEGTLTGRVEGDKITGDWVTGTQKRSVELKKVAATVVAAPPGSADAVSLSGDWDAVADAQGQPFPFFLVLKVEGEKVSGSSSSQLGESSISAGTWKDGKLNFQLDSPDGSITMSATLVEGKLTGEFDLAGQIQGKWVAIKKTK